MGLDTRIVRRSNGTYSFRGHVPHELRHLIEGGKSGQKWVALGTKDPAEAKIRARVESVKFDQELAAAKRRLNGQTDVITEAEAERLAAKWLSQELHRDEADRKAGLDEWDHDQKRLAASMGGWMAKDSLAVGNVGSIEHEVEWVLGQESLHVKPGSESWRRLGYALLKANRRYHSVLQERNEGEVVETPALPKAVDAKRACTVEELIQAYLDNPSKKRTPGTLKTYNTVFRAMRELLGPDTPVDSIHPMDCERVRSILLRLPKNATQRFPKLSLEEAAQEADRLSLERLGPAAVNNYLHNLSALFKWGVKTWRVTRNPAEGLAIPDDTKGKEGKPFSVEHLRAIFNAPIYTGCQDDEEDYAKPGPNRPRHGRFWVPLISLWTGMRLGECCQLRTADITEYEGVPVILITDTEEPGADEADKKRIKTKAGHRFVPVHPELERIGFLTFVAEMRDKGERRLFPEIKPDSLGYLSGTFSKWFNDKRRFLGKLGIAGQGVTFHSFRHNYRDALREAGISLERVRALGGWVRDSDGEEARYGKGLSAETLYREIQKVSYPGLDLSHLYV